TARAQRFAILSFVAVSAFAAASLVPRAAGAVGPITKVVVYTDRAQITRTQAVDCGAGVAHFPGLPATLDPKTLSATLTGGAGGVEGVSHEEEATPPRAQADELEKQIRALDETLAAVRAEIDAARATEGKVVAYGSHLQRTWSEQAIMNNPPTGAWDAGLDLLRHQALGAAKRRQAAEVRQRDLLRQRAILAADLQRVQESRRRTTVKVSAFLRCRGTRTVLLSYVVPNATWRIAYQTTVEPAQRRATIVARALVQQRTGEDWTGVKLAVSGANLTRDSSPPTIQKMSVTAHKPHTVQKILSRRFEQREHLTTADTGGEQDGKKQAAVAGLPAALTEQIQLELEALEKATIPADGREVIVTLEKRQLGVEIVLEAVPKLFPYVYERATLHNPFPFAMPPGPMALHRGHAYIGTAQMKLRSPREPFAVALAVPHELQADRYLKVERLDKPGALGTKKKLLHRYEIDLGNWTNQAQRIRVLENVPVTQESEIEVSLDSDATPPTRWNKEDGILTWDVTLPARSKKTITVSYTVSLPNAYVVTGY
ncbi:MAG: mucoidy inhibitor MuiA family protein, partial [Deltaproteobacteria bacterium]|nr:mucoidy inhibitor MuiA family protein [Deltaproteobacteria bacterium]